MGASSDGETLLPERYRRNGVAMLVERAKPRGLVVTANGGERYTVSDVRGRLLMREVTFADAMEFFEGLPRRKRPMQRRR